MTYTRNTDGLIPFRENAKAQAAQRHAEAVKMYHDGVPIREIAGDLGYREATVRAILSSAGIQTAPRPRPFTDEERERAKALLDDGATYHEVGRTLGRTMDVIQRNVPGYPVLKGTERAKRSALVRQINRIETKIRK